MSEENIAVVRQAIAAYSGTGAVVDDLFTPETEIWESPELPGDLAGQGRDALLRAKEILFDSFEEWSIDPQKFFAAGLAE